MEEISKIVLGSRWREAPSIYYLYLEKKGIPESGLVHYYHFCKNLNKPKSEINYIPLSMSGREPFEDELWHDDEPYMTMMIDLENEELVDFLLRHENNDKWIKIWEVFWCSNVDFDLFESRLFELIFLEGKSIKEISNITETSNSWISRHKKKLIEKIKESIKK
jgi:hypothetical protein